MRFPTERIERASAVHIDPARWFILGVGWGYRGSLTLFGRAAVILRTGPGLRLDLTDGKSFYITIDDPDTAAGVESSTITTNHDVTLTAAGRHWPSAPACNRADQAPHRSVREPTSVSVCRVGWSGMASTESHTPADGPMRVVRCDVATGTVVPCRARRALASRAAVGSEKATGVLMPVVVASSA